MAGRSTAVLLALAVSGAPALAKDDTARSREGGSSTTHQSAGERHHSGGAASGGDRHHSGGASDHKGSSGSQDSGAFSAPPTGAQSRHPRAGTGTGYRDSHGRRFNDSRFYGRSGYGAYGGRYYYDPFYSWWGYSPYYYSGYYGYSPHYYRSRYRDSGAVRIQVDPEKTRVYVDGYYAGVVDDFDGLFQRLYLPPGRHEISLRLEGYRTHRFKVYVPVDQTLKIHHDMVRGDGEATEEVLGKPEDEEREDRRYGRRDDDRDDRYGRRESDDDGDEMDRDGRRGTLSLDVQPLDATVYVDGQFRGTGRDARHLRLPVGKHRIEVVRPGFRTVEREVEVRQGPPAELKIELERSS
jgi:hypothetical protein